jgi:hypothetical protein
MQPRETRHGLKSREGSGRALREHAKYNQGEESADLTL